MDKNVITISNEIMGGTPVFKNTRVPIKTLLEFIENGMTIDAFLNEFPSVTKSQVSEVLIGLKEKIDTLVA